MFYVIEDDFGPFLAEPGYAVHPEDKILMNGTKEECQVHLRQLMEKILDDSPDEFWRDYNSTETGEGTTA